MLSEEWQSSIKVGACGLEKEDRLFWGVKLLISSATIWGWVAYSPLIINLLEIWKLCALAAGEKCGLLPPWLDGLQCLQPGASSAFPLISEEDLFPCTCILDGASPRILRDPSRRWWRCSVVTMKELGVKFGLLLCQQRWPKLFWLRFIMNSVDNLSLLTPLKSTKASSFQCTSSVLEWIDFFSFKLSFVLSRKLQLKFGKF